ncbi:MAG TPA: DinB family protein [Terriglobia bacterium]|nr:DinB family protein [Terriglobia bacterium]
MAEIQFLRKLFDYDYWANLTALDSLTPLEAGKPLDYFAHVLGASRIWLARFSTADPKGIDVWPKPTLAQCRDAVDELRQGWTAVLDRLTPEGLAQNLVYRNTKGVEFSTPIVDVLMHLVMHSAYHRGQVASAVRAAGGKPALTDYVAWVRQVGASG